MALNDNDLLLINDSQDSFEAKKIKYSTLKSNIQIDVGASDLQAVTDVGNTTTNSIVINDNISLNADGRSSFAANMIVGLEPNGGANAGCGLRADGLVQASRAANSNLWSGYLQGNSVSTSRITSDGKITSIINGPWGNDTQSLELNFAHDGTGTSTSPTTTGAILFQDNSSTSRYAGIQCIRNNPSIGNGSDIVISCNPGGTSNTAEQVARFTTAGNLNLGGTLPASPNITLNADGSATFGSGITNGDYDPTGNQLVLGKTNNHSGLTIRSSSDHSGSIYFADGTSGASQQLPGFIQYQHNINSMLFGVNNNTDSSLVLNADGSATFSGDVELANQLRIDGSNDPARNQIISQNNSTPTFVVKASGTTYVGGSDLTGGSPQSNITLNADGTIEAANLTDGTTTKTMTEVLEGGGGTFSAGAWFNYDGAAKTITSASNVASMDYVGTGKYTANFATPLANADYAHVSGSTKNENDQYPRIASFVNVGTKTTTQCGVHFAQSGGTSYNDYANVCMAFFAT